MSKLDEKYNKALSAVFIHLSNFVSPDYNVQHILCQAKFWFFGVFVCWFLVFNATFSNISVIQMYHGDQF
jgi:hypothetical protein